MPEIPTTALEVPKFFGAENVYQVNPVVGEVFRFTALLASAHGRLSRLPPRPSSIPRQPLTNRLVQKEPGRSPS